jgi:predicted small lipoprotein YifL
MKTRPLLLIAFFGTLAACGDKAPEEVAAAPQPESVAETVTEAAVLPRTPSVEGARVFFITPADGATVSNPVTVEFGIEGMEVVKAGDNQPHSGHHHLLIDTGLPDLGLPIPADSQHVHFGDGSTSTEITLPPGEHTLQMLLGDHLHIPHNPPLSSAVITVTVE